MGEVEAGVARSPAITARVAGLLWLATIVLGVFAEKFVRGELIVRGDAATTGANILASEPLFRLGILADLAGTGAYLGATFLVYELTRPVSRSLALFSALLGLAGSIVLIAGLANPLEALNYLKGGPVLAPLAAGQAQALAYMAIRAHAISYNLAMAVFAGQVLLLAGCSSRQASCPAYSACSSWSRACAAGSASPESSWSPTSPPASTKAC